MHTHTHTHTHSHRCHRLCVLNTPQAWQHDEGAPWKVAGPSRDVLCRERPCGLDFKRWIGIHWTGRGTGLQDWPTVACDKQSLEPGYLQQERPKRGVRVQPEGLANHTSRSQIHCSCLNPLVLTQTALVFPFRTWQAVSGQGWEAESSQRLGCWGVWADRVVCAELFPR